MAVEAFSEFPEEDIDTEPMDTSEHVEEYTDEQGRKVKRIMKRTVVKTTTTKGYSSVAPENGAEPEEHVEEFTDEQGRKVRRVTKRVVRRIQVREYDIFSTLYLIQTVYYILYKFLSLTRREHCSPRELFKQEYIDYFIFTLKVKFFLQSETRSAQFFFSVLLKM